MQFTPVFSYLRQSFAVCPSRLYLAEEGLQFAEARWQFAGVVMLRFAAVLSSTSAVYDNTFAFSAVRPQFAAELRQFSAVRPRLRPNCVGFQ